METQITFMIINNGVYLSISTLKISLTFANVIKKEKSNKKKTKKNVIFENVKWSFLQILLKCHSDLLQYFELILSHNK